METNNKTVYQLRKAAGTYWLLDMEQDGPAYTKPVPLNESGAYIWQLLEAGHKTEQAARIVAAEYGITADEAGEDIRQFLQNLHEHGVRPEFGGEKSEHAGDQEVWKCY